MSNTETQKQQTTSGKHTLQSKWTFWFTKKPKSSAQTDEDFKNLIVKLGSFQTIEDFASYYVHLAKPSKLPKGCYYHLFRDEVPPMWESYPNGGCYILRMKKRNEILDRVWESLIFAAIGEAFETPDVVGVELCIRQKEDVLSIWLRDCSNQKAMYAIGEKLRSVLHLKGPVVISYKYNKSAMKDKSTFRNTKNFVIGGTSPADEKE